ncbi:MAG: endonuclease III [Chthonomonadales bacterium]
MPTVQEKERALEVLRLLEARYPGAECALHHRNAWELLISTILSAQCTDARVNQVTPVLFARYPDPEALANADPSEVEEIIHSLGAFRNKAKSIIGVSQAIVDQYGGVVPNTMEELTAMPGVGRKTANVVLGVAFGKPAVVVDTHVQRIARRLGWTSNTDPNKIEQDLMQLLPPEKWTSMAHTLILHGRTLCTARGPKCSECPVQSLCPSAVL